MMAGKSATRPRTVALVGNPNVGKSTLFNALTGLHQTVGNYPGVTVDRTEGIGHAASGEAVRVVDLPGVVSLAGHSPDERIALDVLTGGVPGEPAPDVVVVVLDASNIRRGLYLLAQILELPSPVVVCLNMVDEADRAGNQVNPVALSNALGGVTVIETVASRGIGVGGLIDAALRAEPRAAAAPGGAAGGRGQTDADVARRQAWADSVLKSLRLRMPVTPRDRSDRIDRVLLHPVLGSAIFVVVMACLFQAVFTWAEPIMGAIDGAFGWLQDLVREHLPEGWVRDLVADGIIAGVGGVLAFLPQIVLLFVFLGILEDTGYMTRAAFLVDRPLRVVGLSGRAFIPLLSSFACAIPGIMATRTIGSRRERLLTIMVAPLMTCAARLPIYALFIGAFVPDEPLLGPIRSQGAMLLALYAAGILVASLAAFVIGKTVLRGERDTPILEMPPYRMPGLAVIAHKLWHRSRAFLVNAGTIIFVVAVVMWALTYLPRAEVDPARTDAEQAAFQQEQSIAGHIGRAIEPAIAPIGGDWRVGVGILSSYLAREVFVATMAVVYATGDGEDAEGENRLRDALRSAKNDRTGLPLFTWPTVLALLAFFVVAPQCASTLAVIRREAGSWRWVAFVFVYLTGLAYLAALLTHRIAAALID